MSYCGRKGGWRVYWYQEAWHERVEVGGSVRMSRHSTAQHSTALVTVIKFQYLENGRGDLQSIGRVLCRGAPVRERLEAQLLLHEFEDVAVRVPEAVHACCC